MNFFESDKWQTSYTRIVRTYSDIDLLTKTLLAIVGVLLVMTTLSLIPVLTQSPPIPVFTVTKVFIRASNVSNDGHLNAAFELTIQAYNPHKIGINYMFIDVAISEDRARTSLRNLSNVANEPFDQFPYDKTLLKVKFFVQNLGIVQEVADDFRGAKRDNDKPDGVVDKGKKVPKRVYLEVEVKARVLYTKRGTREQRSFDVCVDFLKRVFFL